MPVFERSCLPMALGCQLLEAETSERRRFLGSYQEEMVPPVVRLICWARYLPE